MSVLASKFQRSVTPIDDEVFDERSYASAKQIDKTVARARQAASNLASSSLEQRMQICEQALKYFSNNKMQMAREISLQMGRPISYSPMEVDGAIARAEHMLSIARESLSPKIMPASNGCERYIERVPLGVVFVVAPWNYPYLTAINTIIPAILAGNAVILKHSAQTPLCGDRFAQAFSNYADCLQSICLDHSQVADLVAHPSIDFVAFTGSVSGGQAITRAAKNKFISLGLELGGKDPAYVRSDADLNFSVENIVDGAFFNSGQSCCAVERIYVHASIYADFVAAFSAKVRSYKVGDPFSCDTTLGPLVKSSAANYVRGQITAAVNSGAKALINNNRQLEGAYCAPQVLANVDHGMSIMSDETFGPAVGIMSVKDDLEAIDLMNDSEFGLTASVWSQDQAAAVNVLGNINTGTCFLNRCDYLDPALAWSGVKNSGNGCSLSEYGFLQLTRPKSFYLRCD